MTFPSTGALPYQKTEIPAAASAARSQKENNAPFFMVSYIFYALIAVSFIHQLPYYVFVLQAHIP